MTALTDPVRGSSEPGRYWTTTNVAEATPDILSPLCWTTWGPALEEGLRWSMIDFGVLGRNERPPTDDPNRQVTAAFYGRQAINVDELRSVLARLPGLSPDDVERDLMGSVRPGLTREPGGSPLRLPIVLAKMPSALLRISRQVRAMHADHHSWWRRDVLQGGSGPGGTLALLLAGQQRFTNGMIMHGRMRWTLPVTETVIAKAAERADRPDLGRAVLGGHGNVAETEMADDVWRIAAGDLTVEDFVACYGFHGPNEGNVYTTSWREQPERVQALVAAFRSRDEMIRPREREQAAITARAEAERELLAALPRTSRPVVRFMMRRNANLTRNLELTKAAFLMGLDGCRAGARAMGHDLVARGILGEVDDAFFLSADELEAIEHGTLTDGPALVDYRRRQRAEYVRMTLPLTWTGMPEPDYGVADQPVDRTAVIRGGASGGGRVEGRARVVLDPHADTALDAGDILVCRFTDPSWAPLFSLAEALVIDIGGSSSHGAVVARELGIPFVIGTGNGSTTIGDGDRILVDGAAGTVEFTSH